MKFTLLALLPTVNVIEEAFLWIEKNLRITELIHIESPSLNDVLIGYNAAS